MACSALFSCASSYIFNSNHPISALGECVPEIICTARQRRCRAGKRTDSASHLAGLNSLRKRLLVPHFYQQQDRNRQRNRRYRDSEVVRPQQHRSNSTCTAHWHPLGQRAPPPPAQSAQRKQRYPAHGPGDRCAVFPQGVHKQRGVTGLVRSGCRFQGIQEIPVRKKPHEHGNPQKKKKGATEPRCDGEEH